MDSNDVKNPSLEPLRERSDYAAQGLDQLERQFVNLPADEQKLIENQFKDRLKRGCSMDNVERIASEIFASEKVAVSPPGWSGTTKAMKKHKNITNPWALSWWMSKRKPGQKWGPGKLSKPAKPHYEEEKKKKSSDQKFAEIIDALVDKSIDVINVEIPEVQDASITESNKSYSTTDTVQNDQNEYITIKTNYKEENGMPVLEEYVVDKNGQTETYDNVDAFIERMTNEGLL